MKLFSKREDAKYKMFQSVVQCGTDNPSVIVKNVAFNDSFQDFSAVVVQITNAAGDSGLNITGFTVGKTGSKKDLSAEGKTMAGRLYAYAAKTGNNALKKMVDISESDLVRLKDSELAPACQKIYDLAEEHKTALADYGLTDAKLAAFKAKINAFAAAFPLTRTAIVNRSVVKAQIRELFKQADTILEEQLDELINDFAAEHPDFVAKYKAARKLIDPKTGKEIKDDKGSNPPA